MGSPGEEPLLQGEGLAHSKALHDLSRFCRRHKPALAWPASHHQTQSNEASSGPLAPTWDFALGVNS